MYGPAKKLTFEEGMEEFNVSKETLDKISKYILQVHVPSYMSLAQVSPGSPFSILARFDEDLKNRNTIDLILENKDLSRYICAVAMGGMVMDFNSNPFQHAIRTRFSMTLRDVFTRHNLVHVIDDLEKKEEDMKKTIVEMFVIKGFMEKDAGNRLLKCDLVDLLKELSPIGINSVYYFMKIKKDNGRIPDLIALSIAVFGNILIRIPESAKAEKEVSALLGKQHETNEAEEILNSIHSDIISRFPFIEDVLKECEGIIERVTEEIKEERENRKMNDDDFE